MLSLRHLKFRYAGATHLALNDVSLEVAAGEVIGLLGPNGAGKTTLIGHLSGLHSVQQGEIQLDGVDFALARAKDPLKIAIAPQEYAFYPTLTVRENLACFAGAGGLRGEAKQTRLADCLAFAQLEPFADQRANRLSGGLKRRLNLAIALLHRPSVLLFDEPTVGVDPQSRAFLLASVKRLAEEGCAVIYASHYMEEVEAIASRVVIMDHGQVLCQGLLPELLSSNAHLLAVGIGANDAPAVMKALAPYGEVRHQGQEVLLETRDALAASFILQQLETHGLVVQSLRRGHTNLEQLFMSLTHHSLRD